MNISDLIDNLKLDIENKLLNQDFDGATKTLEREKQKIRELIGVVMPNFTFEQNRIKFNAEYGGYGYSSHSEAEKKRKEYGQQKYENERKILEKNYSDDEEEEDRIQHEIQQRLFNKSKSELEQRYHIPFQSAQDFIIMHECYESYAKIEENLNLLEETKRKKNAFEALANEDTKNWGEIAHLWKSVYAQTIIDTTETIFNSMQTLQKSPKFKQNSSEILPIELFDKINGTPFKIDLVIIKSS